MPPRENGRAHTRHTHTTRTCVHRVREKETGVKGSRDLFALALDFHGGFSEKHRLNSIHVRPLIRVIILVGEHKRIIYLDTRVC